MAPSYHQIAHVLTHGRVRHTADTGSFAWPIVRVLLGRVERGRSSAASGLGARRPGPCGRGLARRSAARARAVHRRPERPVPRQRRLDHPRGLRRRGGRRPLGAARPRRRLHPGPGARRVQRPAHGRARVPRLGPVVPDPVHASRRSRRDELADPLRVGRGGRDACSSTASAWADIAAPSCPSRSRRPASRPARTSSWCAWTGGPARATCRRRAGRAAGGTTPGSCARSTCGGSGSSTCRTCR